MPCLVGCESDYFCGQLRTPIDGDSIAPYVKIFFGDPDNPEITVGNFSSPKWDNTAVIKSFSLGLSTGVGMEVEILDELGGSFHLFVEKLSKCMKKSQQESNMGVEYGWVISNCDGSQYKYPSPHLFLLPTHLDINVAEGKVKFTIIGIDAIATVFSARHDDIEGTDDLKVHLKTAIQNLASNKDPKFNVEFIRIEKNGTETTFGFKEGGKLGPKDVWSHDGQHKLATIQKWLEPFVTDRGKGIIAKWNPSQSGNPILTLLEDPSLDCTESEATCNLSNNVGSYIVNGGDCSPVISFTNKINFSEAFAHLSTGGNSGGASSGKVIQQENKCNSQTHDTGILQSIPVTSYSWSVHGPRQATKETQKGQAAKNKASISLQGAGITAELRIQGDPRREFAYPSKAVGKKVSLIVINPFHLMGNQNGGCGDWLAQPGCNDFLSNRDWQITKVDHTIKDGSYITTIALVLPIPGITTKAGGPFGGPGSGGYVPNNTC